MIREKIEGITAQHEIEVCGGKFPDQRGAGSEETALDAGAAAGLDERTFIIADHVHARYRRLRMDFSLQCLGKEAEAASQVQYPAASAQIKLRQGQLPDVLPVRRMVFNDTCDPPVSVYINKHLHDP